VKNSGKKWKESLVEALRKGQHLEESGVIRTGQVQKKGFQITAPKREECAVHPERKGHGQRSAPIKNEKGEKNLEKKRKEREILRKKKSFKRGVCDRRARARSYT